MDEFLVPLKLKYTSRKASGKFVSKTNNSGKKQLAKQGMGNRRRQGLGFTARDYK